MTKINSPVVDKTKEILKKLNTKKNNIQLDILINTLNKYIQGAIELSNPLNVAKNLHKGNYIERINGSQLWTMKKFYEMLNYTDGLIDVGNRFLIRKNYHGAFQSFHIARYSPGLIEMTKMIVEEVKTGNRHNIAYAKNALVDIVQLEGNKDVKEYINTIAEAYITEYKHLMKHHTKHNAYNTYLYDARELYKLNKNMIGVAKTTAKIAYHKMGQADDLYFKEMPIDNPFDS